MFLDFYLERFFERIETYDLSSGFRVVLFEERKLPEVALNIMFHIGSKDEKEGERGYAHLFEHLMFQGSLNSPVDYFKALEKFGARVNGGTMEDRTIYFDVFPKDLLEYVFFLESDRLKNLFPFITEDRLLNQIEVVKNEKRQIIENQPYGIVDEAISELLFPENHPYRHPVIGYFEDLENATLKKMKSFFDRFYVPRNGSIAICGDFEKDKVIKLLEKYFGSIPSGKFVPPMNEWIPPIVGNPFMRVFSNVALKRVYYLWTVPSFFSNDNKNLILLSLLLSNGKDSPLQKRLVVENPYCQSVSASLFNGEVCGVFIISAILRKSENEKIVEKIIFEEINKIKNQGIEDKDFKSTLLSVESSRIKSLENIGGFGGLSDILNFYNLYFGKPDYFKIDLKNLFATKKEELKSSLQKYLSTQYFAKLSVEPKRKSECVTVNKPSVKIKMDFALQTPILERSKSGLNIYRLKEDIIPFSTFKIIFKKGAKDDPVNLSGLTSMVTDLLDEGSSGKTNIEISREFKEIGAFCDISCDKEAITISVQSPSRFCEKVADLLSSISFAPDFPEEEIERVRKLKIATNKSGLKNPEELGGKISRALLFGKDSPYGHLIEGNFASLNSIKREDIISFYSDILNNSEKSLLAVGNFNEEVIKIVEEKASNKIKSKNFLKESISTPAPINSLRLFFLKFKDIPSAYITAFTLTEERNSLAFPSLSIFNTIFGGKFTSRLNKVMREEKGYTYGVRTLFLLQKGKLPWILETTVEKSKTSEAISDILSELEKITSSMPPTKEEFEEAKNGSLSRFLQNFETQEERAENFAKLIEMDLPVDFYKDYIKRFEKTTLKEVIENSKKIFTTDKISFLVVGNVDKTFLKNLPFKEITEITIEDFFY